MVASGEITSEMKDIKTALFNLKTLIKGLYIPSLEVVCIAYGSDVTYGGDATFVKFFTVPVRAFPSNEVYFSDRYGYGNKKLLFEIDPSTKIVYLTPSCTELLVANYYYNIYILEYPMNVTK